MATKHKLILTSLPAAGTRHVDDAQTYEVVTSRAHVNRAGEASGVIVWRSACREPGCGAEIRQETGFKIRSFNRKCALHSLWAGKARLTEGASPSEFGLLAERPEGDLVTAEGQTIRLAAGWRFSPSYGAPVLKRFAIVPGTAKLISAQGFPILFAQVTEDGGEPYGATWKPGGTPLAPEFAELDALLAAEHVRLVAADAESLL